MAKRLICTVLVVLAGCLSWAGAAVAGAPATAFVVHSLATPSTFSASDTQQCLSSLDTYHCDTYQVTVTNAGALAADGSAVVLTDALPAGVVVQQVNFFWSALPLSLGGNGANLASFGLCTTSPVQCHLATGEFGLPPISPDDWLRMEVLVTVPPGLEGSLPSTARVSGGGAAEASRTVENQFGGTLPSFGLLDFGARIGSPDATVDTRAGGHPYDFTVRIDPTSKFRITPSTRIFAATSVEDVKDVVVDLPVGFLGSALATPECTFAQLSSHVEGGVGGCPADTVVGRIRTDPGSSASVNGPLYDMAPEHGVAAEFGYIDLIGGAHLLYASVVPTPSGYVLRTTSPDVPQILLTDVEVTLFGNPSARDGGGSTPAAFFTNPSACTGEPLVTSIHMDSWQHPGRVNADGTPDFSDPRWASSTSQSPPVTGCNELRFVPSLTVRPETSAADSPSGLDVDLKVPQSEDPNTLATPPLRDATVTLPAGLTLNPAAASGLGACSPAQIALGSASEPTCPESSKIGTVEVSTPLIGGTLTGSVYLATQNENPFHTLLAGYIVIDDPTKGVVVKIPGNLTPDPGTGRITGVFDDNPQLPFSDLRLHFFGGVRGELATPTGCGTYTTTSDLMPWSAPASGPDATPSDSFPIDSGCVSAFAPSLTAGTIDPHAGGYSPFTLSLSRSDGDQNLAGVSVSLPEGLLGKIAGIPLCPDANANAGTCPEASKVGSVQAGAGVGPDPLFVSGSAYLTGPYNGGPYGLVVEVPAVAGPFDLGTVVVRQSLRIDPHTARVTDVSDPIPTIIDGIPLRVRRVDVTLDRPGFTFNPTSCTPTAITGTVSSTEGTTANVSSRFQAAGCRELAFKPSFKVTTQAKTSKKGGASLDVRVGSSQGQANIGKVAVTLPKALPSRLSTIQQACPEATFNANPASCPAGSDIGTATAHTPVLAGPLVGPAYLVSHGGAGFPDLVVILQGEGVTLDLVGSIDIKKSITSSTFASVPDAPISSFELSLPEGSHSALTAVLPAKVKGNLCGQSLTMPTTLTGQNGAVVKQATKIAVTGCSKAKKKGKKSPKKRPRGARGRKANAKKGSLLGAR